VVGVGERRREHVGGVGGGLGRAAGLAPRAVRAALEVDGVAVAALAPVEAAVALAPRVSGGDEALDDVAATVERLVRVVPGQARGERRVDGQHEVEPDEVEQREDPVRGVPKAFAIAASASSTGMERRTASPTAQPIQYAPSRLPTKPGVSAQRTTALPSPTSPNASMASTASGRVAGPATSSSSRR
jgi:hypothetical protein